MCRAPRMIVQNDKKERMFEQNGDYALRIKNRCAILHVQEETRSQAVFCAVLRRMGICTEEREQDGLQE